MSHFYTIYDATVIGNDGNTIVSLKSAQITILLKQGKGTRKEGNIWYRIYLPKHDGYFTGICCFISTFFVR